AQHARAKANILPYGLKQRHAVHAINLLANSSGVAQLAMRRSGGVLRRHTAGDVLSRFGFQVSVELAGALLVPALPAKEFFPTHGLLVCRPQDLVDGAHQLLPPAGLLRQLLSAGLGQAVITCFAIVLRCSPK